MEIRCHFGSSPNTPFPLNGVSVGLLSAAISDRASAAVPRPFADPAQSRGVEATGQHAKWLVPGQPEGQEVERPGGGSFCASPCCSAGGCWAFSPLGQHRPRQEPATPGLEVHRTRGLFLRVEQFQGPVLQEMQCFLGLEQTSQGRSGNRPTMAAPWHQLGGAPGVTGAPTTPVANPEATLKTCLLSTTYAADDNDHTALTAHRIHKKKKAPPLLHI